MKFGKNAEEAAKDTRGGGSSGFMKYPKAGDNIVRIIDEPEKWVYYWEHYNPGGFPFPCTNERDTCPGCTSDDEKMKKASRKVAMNCYDGQYTNVWKFPNQSVGDKLKARFERQGTITDRDYLIRQVKTSNSTEYDIEGLDKEPLTGELTKELESHWTDPEVLLAQAYEDAWGDSKVTQQAKTAPKESKATSKLGIKREEPKEDKTISEAELRAMEPWDLAKLAEAEGFGEVPAGTDTSDEIVDWMLTSQS